MRLIRRLVYRLGFRPQLGSIFHSPSWIDIGKTFWAEFDKALLEGAEEQARMTDAQYISRQEYLDTVNQNLASASKVDIVFKPADFRALGEAFEEAEKNAQDRRALKTVSNSWFTTSPLVDPKTIISPFFCPLCGDVLLHDGDGFLCDVQGMRFEVRVGTTDGRHEIIINSL